MNAKGPFTVKKTTSKNAVIVSLFAITMTALTPFVYGSDVIEKNLLKSMVVKGEPITSASIQQRMQDFSVPGVSIAVIQDGKIVWAKGYGLANADSQRQVDTETLFQAGSISKPIAALSALKLVEEGKLTLDSDVNEHLKQWQLTGPELSTDTHVSLRQLLTHTAGLNVHGFPGYDTGSELPTTTGVLKGEGNTDAVIVKQVPGTNWQYSGGGYTVMQLIVEQLTGQSFAQYTDAQIMRPMGMTLSTYQHDLSESLKLQASAAFNQEGDMYDVIYNDYPEKAAAGLWTTPTDIAKYALHMQAIMQGKKDGVLQKAIVEQMFTAHENNWGLGPEMFEFNGKQVFGHGGKNLGFTNNFRAAVNQGGGVIVMANGDNANKLNREIMITLSEHYKLGVAEQRVIEAIALSDEDLKNVQGNYKMLTEIGFDGDFIANLSVSNGNLFVTLPGDDNPARLVPTAKSRFTSLESGYRYDFNTDQSGKIVGMTVAERFELEKLD